MATFPVKCIRHSKQIVKRSESVPVRTAHAECLNFQVQSAHRLSVPIPMVLSSMLLYRFCIINDALLLVYLMQSAQTEFDFGSAATRPGTLG